MSSSASFTRSLPKPDTDGRLWLNIGPQHPSTHGVLRLEVLCKGEEVLKVLPHLGYLHRCFEKHCESLNYAQIIPYVDRMDYVASMNNEHAYVMGVERMIGLEGQLPKRIEYIRVMVSELNRIASHLIAMGTYGLDIGATTAFLWTMRDRELILRLLEQLSGARMLYNYIWIGGLYYDMPLGFEEQTLHLISYLKKRLNTLNKLLLENPIFIRRTAQIGILHRSTAIQYGVSGPMLRATGLRYDLRRIDNYSVYEEIDFEIPIGRGEKGTTGDCWDRTYVRYKECTASIQIIEQCITALLNKHQRSPSFDPRALIPKKIRPKAQDLYIRAENPKGELGFFFRSSGTDDQPLRCKARSCCFANLSVLPELCVGHTLSDLIAIVGSIDFIMGEVDR